MKTTLSIEESARLIELGVDANKASEIEYRPKKCGYGRNKYLVYSLADLLSILQKQMGYAQMNIKLSADLWRVTFTPYVSIGATPQKHVFKAPELIDALNQLLIWCLTEKKINFNTEKHATTLPLKPIRNEPTRI